MIANLTRTVTPKQASPVPITSRYGDADRLREIGVHLDRMWESLPRLSPLAAAQAEREILADEARLERLERAPASFWAAHGHRSDRELLNAADALKGGAR